MKRTRITRADYFNIKIALKTGKSKNAVAKEFNRGYPTVDFIEKSKSLQDYRQMVYDHYAKYRKDVKNPYGLKGVKGERNVVNKDTEAMRSSYRLTEEEYDRIKTLKSLGLTIGQILKVSERSRATLISIFESENFQDYKTQQAQRQQAVKERLSNKTSAIAPSQITSETNTELIKVLAEVTSALNNLAVAYNHHSAKLDEVLDAKRPWMQKVRG